MAMTKEELDQTLRQAFPNSDITVIDLAGDGDHYEAHIASPLFRGKTRVQQHQMVYTSLGGKMGHALHALALKTKEL